MQVSKRAESYVERVKSLLSSPKFNETLVTITRRYGAEAAALFLVIAYGIPEKETDYDGFVSFSVAELTSATGVTKKRQQYLFDLFDYSRIMKVKFGGIPRRKWYKLDLPGIYGIYRELD